MRLPVRSESLSSRDVVPVRLDCNGGACGRAGAGVYCWSACSISPNRAGLVKGRVIDVMTPSNRPIWTASCAIGRLRGRRRACRVQPGPGEVRPALPGLPGRSFDCPRTRPTDRIPSGEAGRPAGLTCFDGGRGRLNAQPMFDYMDKHDTRSKQEIEARSRRCPQTRSVSVHPALTATAANGEHLVPRYGQQGLYLRTNAVGAGDGFVGADGLGELVASQLTHVRQHPEGGGPRATRRRAAGGHTAILKDLLAVDDRRTAEDVRAISTAPIETADKGSGANIFIICLCPNFLPTLEPADDVGRSPG